MTPPGGCGRNDGGARPRVAPPSGHAAGRTALFIHRPYEWQLVDLLLTNFHLPRTTLLMMIDAFVGPRWRDLYATGAGRRLPVPLLRRRHAAASADGA